MSWWRFFWWGLTTPGVNPFRMLWAVELVAAKVAQRERQGMREAMVRWYHIAKANEHRTR